MDPNNVIDSATASTILKWAVGILLTGFIAQFGKKFATYLMEKVKSLRKGTKQAGEIAGHGECGHGEMQRHARDQYIAASQAAAEKARLKIEKKKLKNRIKGKKK
jgi:hypothetical protein